tara:strand:+ start:465373 stop:467067 length:1695 start_codon:yes stop_codon:yes gene_type:complete
MIKKLLLFFFLGLTLNVLAQVTNEGTPASWDLVQAKTSFTSIVLDEVDIQQVKKEDEVNDEIRTKPYRIGISKKVDFGLNNSGVWTDLANGDRIWRILFNSKNALHLSVIFDDYFLPEGGKVYLYNNDRSDLIGAYTNLLNNEKNVLSTWFVNGDELWVEYYEPKEVKGQGRLNLATVIHGYRLGNSYQKNYQSIYEKNLGDSGDCNHDVDCPIGADFEVQRDLVKKSVAFLLMPDLGGGAFICSGTLINNTDQDKTPYFLTADHCSGTPPSLYSMRFNWISPNPICAGLTNSSDSEDEFIMTGATLKANNTASDVMLLELNNPIPNTWDVTFAGWDKTDAFPSYVVGIHHPQGDIMKISRDDTGPIKANHSINGSPSVATWEITTSGGGWEIGVTEGGSSGSALFNPNGLIIGQLFGGGASCLDPPNQTSNNGALDFYGRFAVSWDNGTTQATRLKEWLDPGNSNPNTLNSLENVLAVNDEFLEQHITVFPNPTTGTVQVKTSGLVGALNYSIYNVLGQAIQSKTLNNQESIQLGNLPNDIYFIKITEIDTNKSLVKKIVLSK